MNNNEKMIKEIIRKKSNEDMGWDQNDNVPEDNWDYNNEVQAPEPVGGYSILKGLSENEDDTCYGEIYNG